MSLLRSIYFASATLLLASCSQTGLAEGTASCKQSSAPFNTNEARIDLERLVDIVGVVKEYGDSLRREHFEDGSYRAHRITTIKISEPERFRNCVVAIRHPDDVTPDKIWQEKGTQLTFAVPLELLELLAGYSGFISVNTVSLVSAEEPPPDVTD